jgi:hypothetical protein
LPLLLVENKQKQVILELLILGFAFLANQGNSWKH